MDAIGTTELVPYSDDVSLSDVAKLWLHTLGISLSPLLEKSLKYSRTFASLDTVWSTEELHTI